MECRPFEVTIVSARDLKDVNLFSKMDVYAAVAIKGDPYSKQKQKTHVHKDSGPNPTWNFTMKFTLNEDSLQHNRLFLKVKLKSDRSFGDKEIGEVEIPVKELIDQNKERQHVSYGVRTSSGKTKGTLTFSYKFGEKYDAPQPKKAEEPVVAYPASAAGASAYPYPHPGGYPPHADASKGHGQGQYPYPYPYPQPAAGYAPPPPQPAYGGYPPAPGYGYPGYPQQQQAGYSGYGYAAQQPPKKSSGAGKMALGVGAGLLGGLLVGDMISDVGEMAAYDAGYDSGFGDGLDF